MSKISIANTIPGQVLPETEHTPDNVQLFLYNAALWNAHRIHFDLPYATQTEGYEGLVIAGPLMGDWLAQCIEGWIGDAGTLTSLSYSNRQVACIGETLTVGGTVRVVDPKKQELEFDLFVKNERGEVITPGSAIVRLKS